MDKPVSDLNLTADQLHTLRHMLGINRPEQDVPKPYRNYAAVTPGNSEFVELAKLGVIRRYQAANERTCYDWYTCTEAGMRAAMASFRTIQLSRSARRYHKFCDLRDCIPDLTFRQFLTSPEFKDYR